MSGQRWWSCQIHRTEGRAVVRRVLRNDSGEASWRDGWLTIDQAAFDHLVHLGTVSEEDGHIVWGGEDGRPTTSETGVPVVRFGRDFYVLTSAT